MSGRRRVAGIVCIAAWGALLVAPTSTAWARHRPHAAGKVAPAPPSGSTPAAAPAPAVAPTGNGLPPEQRARARAAWEAGQKAFALSHYDEAVKHFEEAYGIDPAPAFLFNLARSHTRQYDIDESAEHLRRAVKLYETFLASQPESPRRPEVLAEITALKQRIASLAPTKPAPVAAAPVDAQPGEAATSSATASANPGTSPSAASSASSGALPLTASAPSTSGPASEAKTPIYKRWWLWTAVGVVVVGGTAAALGATLGQRSPYPELGVGSP